MNNLSSLMKYVYNLLEIDVPSATMPMTDILDAIGSYMAMCTGNARTWYWQPLASAQGGNGVMHSNEQPCQGQPVINHTPCAVTFRRKVEH